MRITYLFLVTIFTWLLQTGYVQANSDTTTEINVVTSFSILENLVHELGGSHVQIINLVGPNADAHFYQPRPSDAVAVSKADLVVVNGLGFEGWLTRLMDDNGYEDKRLVASQGVDVIRQNHEIDPHAWQSFNNIRIYADNIAKALIKLHPANRAEFTRRHGDFLHKVEILEKDVARQMAEIPHEKRVVVTSHDAFGYLGRELGIHFLAPVGLSTDEEASAANVAALSRQIENLNIKALFLENISNPRLLKQISDETGAAMGDRLFSDALSEPEGPASTYLAMMRHNIDSIIKALMN